MSDLISRCEVNDVIDELEVYTCGRPNTVKVEVSVLQLQRLINKLKNIPTAYSVDKVVEELEIRVNEANNNCLCEMHENGHTLDFENENGRIKGLKDAIEIVKQGIRKDISE